MKQLQNRRVEFTARGEAIEATYVAFARSCLDNPPQGGFTLDEQRKRLRVLDALDGVAEDGVVVLEDGDAEKLQECVKAMRWAMMAKPILEFAEAVADMKSPPKSDADD